MMVYTPVWTLRLLHPCLYVLVGYTNSGQSVAQALSVIAKQMASPAVRKPTTNLGSSPAKKIDS